MPLTTATLPGLLSRLGHETVRLGAYSNATSRANAIRSALASTTKDTVVISGKGTFEIDRDLQVGAGRRLLIEPGVTLKFADTLTQTDYHYDESSGETSRKFAVLSVSAGASVELYCTLDANAANVYSADFLGSGRTAHPNAFHMFEADNARVHGVWSAQGGRAGAIMAGCDHAVMAGVTVENPWTPASGHPEYQNGNGVGMTGCTNCIIEHFEINGTYETMDLNNANLRNTIRHGRFLGESTGIEINSCDGLLLEDIYSTASGAGVVFQDPSTLKMTDDLNNVIDHRNITIRNWQHEISTTMARVFWIASSMVENLSIQCAVRNLTGRFMNAIIYSGATPVLTNADFDVAYEGAASVDSAGVRTAGGSWTDALIDIYGEFTGRCRVTGQCQPSTPSKPCVAFNGVTQAVVHDSHFVSTGAANGYIALARASASGKILLQNNKADGINGESLDQSSGSTTFTSAF